MICELRVLLIDLGSERREINEPIGICSIASYVKKHAAFKVQIDFGFFPLTKEPSIMHLATYDVIGFSTKIGSLNKITEFYEKILLLPVNSRPSIVFGDLLATFATEQILEIFPQVICVVGEGEASFVSLLEAILEAKQLNIELASVLVKRDVPNIAFMFGDKCFHSKRLLMNLSDCPSPVREFSKQIAEQGGIIRGESSRGCAWGRCSFCAIQHKYCNETKWRPLSIERIVDELKEMSAIGVKSPFYTDEDFIGHDYKRAIELSKAIINGKNTGNIDHEMNFYVDMRVDSILAKGSLGNPSGKEVLEHLKASGLREVFIGIESGSNEQVKRYKKSSTALKNEKALYLLKSLGISFDIGFIMFDPEMTISELSANIDFLFNTGLNYHDARMTKSLRIEPGTPIVKSYEEKDMITGKLNVNQLTYPYKWNNADVQEVYEVFSQWEEKLEPEIYEIQAATRGEIASEVLRSERRSALGNIRFVEINTLKYLVKCAINRQCISYSTLNNFQEMRHTRVREMLQEIK